MSWYDQIEIDKMNEIGYLPSKRFWDSVEYFYFKRKVSSIKPNHANIVTSLSFDME